MHRLRFVLFVATLAGCGGPLDTVDGGPAPVGPGVSECCDCLLATDLAGEPCATDHGQCVALLEQGEEPASWRCGTGGRPYCSEECGAVWPAG